MKQPTDLSSLSAPVEPRTGSHFPLAAFEQRILVDPDVLGMILTGSLGRGRGDRCSDIDVTLWLRDEALSRPGLIEHYLGLLGEVQLMCSSKHEHDQASHAFVGRDWQWVELGISGLPYPTPHPYWHGTRVVKDTDGQLASLVAASGPPVATLSRDAAHTVIVEAIYYTVYVNVHNMRGSHYHAMAELCELAGSLYGLLANARGREGYDVRNAEQFLSADELALLYATWPVAPTQEAIRRAARGLWEWTHYVWAECEHTLGEELGIAVDTTAILEVIERPYAWERGRADESCLNY
jgi:hypothetical protein